MLARMAAKMGKGPFAGPAKIANRYLALWASNLMTAMLSPAWRRENVTHFGTPPPVSRCPRSRISTPGVMPERNMSSSPDSNASSLLRLGWRITFERFLDRSIAQFDVLFNIIFQLCNY